MFDRMICRAPEDGAGAGGAAAAVLGADTTGAAAPPPGTGTAAAASGLPPAGPKWYEAQDYTPEERAWLAAKGLADDDPMKVVPKLLRGHRNAEQRIGKGLDSIMDRPAKDQPLTAFLKANAETLGLPGSEDAYTVAPPDTWPKDVKWDADLEAKARKVAFDMGLPPEAHKAYVGLFAEKMQALNADASAALEQSRAKMMADLQAEFGPQTDAMINTARAAAQAVAEQAGLSPEQLGHLGAVLGKATGDAAAIRLFAAIGKAMGEDSAVALGRGGPLTMTPAEARAEMAKLSAPNGEWYMANATRNQGEIDRLRPRIAQLSKIAAG